MKFQEVQNCFFEYEDKRHKILQKTQLYFLERGFQPYVWFDEEHRVRIKHKYRRGLKNFVFDNTNKERCELWKIAKQFAKENKLKIHYIFDYCETDRTLPKDVQSQWSTEFILEVKQ